MTADTHTDGRTHGQPENMSGGEVRENVLQFLLHLVAGKCALNLHTRLISSKAGHAQMQHVHGE